MPIRTLRPGRAWALDGARTTFALAVDADGVVRQTYYGPRLGPDDDAWLACADVGSPDQVAVFPVMRGAAFGSMCLRLAYEDGVRDTWLALRSGRVEDQGARLTLILADEAYGLEVELGFRPVETQDLVVRDAVVRLLRGRAVVREAATGALGCAPGAGHRLTHLAGHWAGETQIRREALAEGRKVIGSDRGLTSHEHNPFFALDDGTSGEEHGHVLFGALAHSGNWQVTYEKPPAGAARAVAGLGPEGFAWPLGPGDDLVLPTFVHGLSLGGFGAMSRALHEYVRGSVLPAQNRGRVRPIVYNSWEATYFQVNDAGQRRLAERAAGLGVEVFVLDDGWFGARTNDRAGLGDWEPNPERFPHGLEALVEHVHGLGLGFGLWLEPEMVNPDSDLYRRHPDWVYHYPNRPRTEVRHQLVLNLAKAEVAEFVAQTLVRVVDRYGLDYLKWDMNRPLTEVGSTLGAPDGVEDGAAPLRHVQAVYAILDRLRARRPDLWIEACASGGGRVDLGILARADQVWTSDNTFAVDRLSIQEGYSLAYPANTMDAWVTDNAQAQAPLAFRFHSAMCGVLGIGADLARWTDEDIETARALCAVYKEIRPIVQYGRLYRLRSPCLANGQEAALVYVAPDGGEAVLFAFRLWASGMQRDRPLRVAGLDPERMYRLEVSGDDGGRVLVAPKRMSGRALAHAGIRLVLTGGAASALIRIRAVHGTDEGREAGWR